MAPARFLFGTSMLLLSLLAIASASDYGYSPNPEYGKPKPEEQPLPTKLDYGEPKPEENDKHLSTKPDYEKPNSEGKDKPLPTKPEYENQNPEGKDKLLPTLIGIQGLVLCKSGSKYVPLKGALARITCLAVDENGYETAPFSILSDGCDANGYFLATLSPSFLKDNWKIKECKAFLYYSPLETCKVPMDVNHGMTGALPSSYRILNDKNMKLYSVGPFFYTSEPQSLPNGY